jgi:Flp pilus assembly pilin Flp
MLTSTFIHTLRLRDRIVELVRRRSADQRGAVVVEYAFLLVFIVVVCLSALALFGSANSASATKSANSILTAN